ncbi:MAG: cytochrome c [Paracoccaceae bacterium]|nr:cytochrome c [Paracoccaceae bacterium]
MRALLMIASFCIWPALALAENPAMGRDAFADHCATCHGLGGEGDGPMAAVLSVAPPDLTRLSAANGGVFPASQVVWRVDGTTEVMAHGGPMPIFGLILDGPSGGIVTEDGEEVIASEAVVNIAAWLRGIQK